MKKKIIGIGIGILILAGIICAIGVPLLLDGETTLPGDLSRGDHSNPIPGTKSAGNPHGTYTVSAALPSVPDQITLYAFVKPTITADLVTSMAEKMGLKGTVREADEQMLLSDDPYSLEIHMLSGRVALIDIPRWMNPNDKDLPANLPSDEKAIEIATAYLKDKGLMPEDAVQCGVDHPQIVDINEKGETTGIAFEDVLVSYSRTIDGRPVIGSELTVEVGGGGDILNVYKLWRDYTPEKEIAIITPEEALNKLQSAGIPGDARTVEITEIELGYYEAQAMDDPAHLVPVYIFRGDARDGSTETPFVRYVPASPEFEGKIPEVR